MTTTPTPVHALAMLAACGLPRGLNFEETPGGAAVAEPDTREDASHVFDDPAGMGDEGVEDAAAAIEELLGIDSEEDDRLDDGATEFEDEEEEEEEEEPASRPAAKGPKTAPGADFARPAPAKGEQQAQDPEEAIRNAVVDAARERWKDAAPPEDRSPQQPPPGNTQQSSQERAGQAPSTAPAGGQRAFDPLFTKDELEAIDSYLPEPASKALKAATERYDRVIGVIEGMAVHLVDRIQERELRETSAEDRAIRDVIRSGWDDVFGVDPAKATPAQQHNLKELRRWSRHIRQEERKRGNFMDSQQTIQIALSRAFSDEYEKRKKAEGVREVRQSVQNRHRQRDIGRTRSRGPGAPQGRSGRSTEDREIAGATSAVEAFLADLTRR